LEEVSMGKEAELNYPSFIQLAIFAELFEDLFELFEFLSGFNTLEPFEKKSGLAALILAIIIFSAGDRIE